MTEAAPTINPYDVYRHLRKTAPVSKIGDGPWQIACHQDVNTVLRNHGTFSSEVSLRPVEDRQTPTMLFSDPPIHHRLRKLVSRAFKPSHIEQQRDQITRSCQQLVSQMLSEPEVDLVSALAAPLPVMVIAKMLGVEDGNMQVFKNWSDAIFSNIADILFATPSPEALLAADEMDHYFLDKIAFIREHPQPHLLGRLIETKTEEGYLSDDELLSFCRLLLIAGNETTTGLITAAARVFHAFPATLGQLSLDPSLTTTFIEEALRFFSPFSATVRRTTSEVEIAGQKIPKGELVLPLIASANRDERIFKQADQFDIARNPNPHLAFGFGIHFCLGAHLARLEGEIAVNCLARHFSSIRLTEPESPEMYGLGGPKHLNVSLQVC
jgi:cytochrome P450